MEEEGNFLTLLLFFLSCSVQSGSDSCWSFLLKRLEFDQSSPLLLLQPGSGHTCPLSPALPGLSLSSTNSPVPGVTQHMSPVLQAVKLEAPTSKFLIISSFLQQGIRTIRKISPAGNFRRTGVAVGSATSAVTSTSRQMEGYRCSRSLPSLSTGRCHPSMTFRGTRPWGEG